MINRVFLLLCGNLVNRFQNLFLASGLLEKELGAAIGGSHLYHSPAWGLSGQPDFLNAVLEFETSKSPFEVHEITRSVEEKFKNPPREKWGPRYMDIDVLFFGEMIINNGGLQVPHPLLPSRKFALTPLKELATDFIHPVLNKTVAELLAECTDPLTVTRL
jgi:2-amino-4-hydroxy-6-hydroxymethyldihydropteridine diphosphokinase